MTIKVWFVAFLCCSGAWLAVAGPDQPSEPAPARIDIAWVVSKPLGTFRLNGRFVISALNEDFSTSVSNRADPNTDTSRVEVPPGLYSLTLDQGFELRREGPDAERGVAPSSFSPSPVLVLAQAGRNTPVELALVTWREPLDAMEEPMASANCIN
jgi:hypothetical protein